MATNRIHEVLKRASLFLEQHDKEPIVAELLLQHHLQIDRSQMFMKLREEIESDILQSFNKDLKLHAEESVPIQHIIGYEYFYGRKFIVNEHVLIPRQETEEVVLKSFEIMADKQPQTIVDVGTGSGIIGITIALEKPGHDIYATDISSEALRIARENASRLGAKLTFYEGDFLDPLQQEQITVDLIVSNPPYIPYAEAKNLSDIVRNHDPERALFAKENGLYAYRKILEQAKHVLRPGGQIVFEIGFDQGESVPNLATTYFPNALIDVFSDINGNNRIVTITTL